MQHSIILDHWCTPPENIGPESLNISLDQWRRTFLPQELGPDFQMRSSQCQMFEVTEENLPMFMAGNLPNNQSQSLSKVACRDLKGWTYNQRYTGVTVSFGPI